MIALIGARGGSKRLPGKNTRMLGGMPLIVWTLKAAFDSDVFSGVYVSTDSKDIAETAAAWTGAKVYMRPPHMARDESCDIEWVQQILGAIEYDHHKRGSICAPCSLGKSHWGTTEFAILRPTSPFRDAATIQRAKLQWDDIKQANQTGGCGSRSCWGYHSPGSACACECHRPKFDSMRAIRRATEHPLKQHQYDPDTHEIYPWLKNAYHQHLHSRPTQTLADSWVQTAGLEMAFCRVPLETGSIAGERIAGFELEGPEAHDINTEQDWAWAEHHAIGGMKVNGINL